MVKKQEPLIEESEKKEISFSERPFEEQLRIVDKEIQNIMLNQKLSDVNKAIEQLPLEKQGIVFRYQLALREQEEQKAKELQAQKEQEKKEVLEEYEKIKKEEPENVLKADTKGDVVGPGKIKEFFAGRRINKIKEKAYKKGKHIIIKAYAGRGFEIISSKPVKYVEFKTKNEKGEEIVNITRIAQPKGHLQGTSIPVHLCIEGVANSVDLFQNFETNMSAEYINKLLQGEFETGLTTGLAIRSDKANKFDVAKITPILFIILIAAMGFIAYNQMQLFEIVSKIPGV